MNQKGNVLPAIITALSLLAAVIGAYYLSSQNSLPSQQTKTQSLTQTITDVRATATPEDITNWKVYENTKYGYIINYPTILSHEYTEIAFEPKYGAGATDRYYSGESLIAGGYTGEHVVLSIADSKYFPAESPGPLEKTILLAGQTAQVYEDLAFGFIRVGPIVHNGYKYEFQYDKPSKEANAQFYYQMLESFQFTK